MKEQTVGNLRTLPHWTADTPLTVEQINQLADGTNEALKQLDENVTRNQEAVVGAGEDLNGYVSPGIWQWQRADYAADNPNAPEGCGGYGLFIVEVGGSYIRQTIHLHNSEDAGRCWQRLCQKVGGRATWTAWKENFSEARKPDSMRCMSGGESNVCYGLEGDALWLNKQGAAIKHTHIMNGMANGKYSELTAEKLHGREGVYDGNERVYSPNNVPDKTQVYSTNEMNLDYGFARDDGTIYFNYRGAEKPIQRYAFWGGQPTVGHVDLVAQAYYEGDERVYSPNNKPSAADVGAVFGKLVYQGSKMFQLTTGKYLIFGRCELIGRGRHTGYLSYIKVVYSNQLFVDGTHGSVSGSMGGTDFSETIMQQPSVSGVGDEMMVYRLD